MANELAGYFPQIRISIETVSSFIIDMIPLTVAIEHKFLGITEDSAAEWAKSTIKTLNSKSPLSLKVSLF